MTRGNEQLKSLHSLHYILYIDASFKLEHKGIPSLRPTVQTHRGLFKFENVYSTRGPRFMTSSTYGGYVAFSQKCIKKILLHHSVYYANGIKTNFVCELVGEQSRRIRYTQKMALFTFVCHAPCIGLCCICFL